MSYSNAFIKFCFSLVLLVTLVPVGLAAPRNQPEARGAQRVVAFVGVNVVPMDRERILENQTVLVRDGRIQKIGAANKVKIPADALRIEGQGKYLMPGLTDMHVHLLPGAGAGNDL